jgi:serine/threonine-protein kinase
LGERLQDIGGDGTEFLTRVRQAHPNDFWAAFSLAEAQAAGGHAEAAQAGYRQALALRPAAAPVYNNLGLIPYARRDWSEAYKCFENAIDIDHSCAPAYNNFGLARKGEGDWAEAVRLFRDAIRCNPDLAPAHYNLAEIRAYSGGFEEAIEHYRQALRIDPEFARAKFMLGIALMCRGRMDEAHEHYQRASLADPKDPKAYERLYGRAWNHALASYQRALDIDPTFTVSYNGLGLTPRDAERLHEAIDHYERALALDPSVYMAHAVLGQAFLAQGRCRAAEAAIRRCLEMLPLNDRLRANVLAQHRRCQRWVALQDRLAAVLHAREKPADAREALEFAELCGMLSQPAAAARLYAAAFDTGPQAGSDLGALDRYRAACAAALAGGGRGDGANLSPLEQQRWRQRARDWLRAELALWSGVLDNGPDADRNLVRDKAAHLWSDPDLAGLFARESRADLSPAENKERRALWDAIDVLIRRAQNSG